MTERFERRQEEGEVTLVYRPRAGGEPVELRCDLPEEFQAQLRKLRSRG